MRRYARATDANQPELVAALRKLGVWCYPTHRLGDGFPDCLCWARGRFVLLEIKDGTLPPSRRVLTRAEAAFHLSCPGPLHVVTSLEEAVGVLLPRQT